MLWQTFDTADRKLSTHLGRYSSHTIMAICFYDLNQYILTELYLIIIRLQQYHR